MAKTLFGSSDKSNFILNMDLDKYRSMCGKLMLIVLWAVSIAQGINLLTFSANSSFSDMINEGGGGAVFALLMIMLRSVATVFSIGGVFALITVVIGLMRKQFSKQSAVPYFMLLASLGWAVISLFHSYDIHTSLFGQDGRDEGWFALLFYASFFYLGTMLRRQEDRSRFLSGVMKWGIFQCVWGFLQAIPLFDYIDPNKGLNAYRNLDPMLYWNVRLPAGMTDSPVTYAMLLGMLAAVAVPAAMLDQDRKTRITAAVCAACSVLMVFKTQTVAGLIAGFGSILLAVILFAAKHKEAAGKAILMPVTVLAAAACSAVWVFASPSINHMYYHPDKTVNGTPEAGLCTAAWETGIPTLPNGFTIRSRENETFPALYDGGIVWDDGYYRLSTAGAYSAHNDGAFNVYDAASVLRYCAREGFRTIGIDPLLGVGPDNFYFAQMHVSTDIAANPNAVDRPYNDYIYIAATRGIPSLLLHLALLIVCAYFAWKHRKARGGWQLLAPAGAVLLYALTSITGISVLTVAPLAWFLLGMLSAEPMPEKAAATASEEEKSSSQPEKQTEKTPEQKSEKQPAKAAEKPAGNPKKAPAKSGKKKKKK